jgi:hypothetical protein
MIKLEPGNVLLKPSQRRQLMAWLRRVQRLGQRLGGLVLIISMQRIGRSYEVRAVVADRTGAATFNCRSRRHDWRDSVRELVRRLTRHLHSLNLHHAV